MRFAKDRHAALLHRFQQSRLSFGTGAVDFVRQHQIREHRSLVKHQPAAALLLLEDR